jgi:hypothetical protein
MSEPTVEEMLAFVFSRIDKPHQHHRDCVHNLSREEQLAQRKRKYDGTEWTDEEMRILKLEQHFFTITPDDWEIEVPWADGGSA